MQAIKFEKVAANMPRTNTDFNSQISDVETLTHPGKTVNSTMLPSDFFYSPDTISKQYDEICENMYGKEHKYDFVELIRNAQNIVANKADEIKRSKSLYDAKGATESDYLKIYRTLNKVFDEFIDLQV